MANTIRRCIDLGPPVVWSTVYDELGNDPRYVNVDGDTMTGLLTTEAGIETVGLVSTSDVDITGDLDVTGPVSVTGDTALTGTLSVSSTSTFSGDMTINGTLNSANSYIGSEVQMRVMGSAQTIIAAGPSNTAYVGYYAAAASTSSLGTRFGYVGILSTHMRVWNEVPQPIVFGINNAEIARYNSVSLLIGKTSNSIGTTGVEAYDVGTLYLTRSTTGTGSLYINRTGAANANGQIWAAFTGDGGTLGTIVRNSASTVAYNTSSDQYLKANVQDIDDEEAIEHVEAWHPVAFQWKMKNGVPHIYGDPTGPYEHGFLAQEMYECNPNAVTPGTGTQEDFDAWQEAVVEYEAALQEYKNVEKQREFLELDYGDSLEQWQAECDAARASWNGEGELVLPPMPQPPELPELPEYPQDPGASPYTPWMGDWSKLVPDLAAATQALIRKMRTLESRVSDLETA